MIGKQQAPRLTVIHRDTDVPLVEDDAVTLVGCLHTSILEPVGHHQDNPFRLVAYELSSLVQQVVQDRLLLQVGQFDLVELFNIGAERFPFMPFGRGAFWSLYFAPNSQGDS